MSDSSKSNSTLAVVPAAEAEMKGWLAKWTNYLKGYQKRWFVLSNGLLSYYRNQAEMSHTCRGTISLVSAVIHTEDSCNFVISNGGTQTFHLKAGSEVERQKWVTALELAKSHSIRKENEEDDVIEVSMQEAQSEQQNLLKTLALKMDDLKACNDQIGKHGQALMRCLNDLEQSDNEGGETSKKIMKQVNERATLFRITSSSIMKTSEEYLSLVQSLYTQWSRLLDHEHNQRGKLEEQLEQLARQHSHLEKCAKEAASGGWSYPQSAGSEGDEDEFFDAAEENAVDFMLAMPSQKHKRTGSTHSEGQDCSGSESEGRDDNDKNKKYEEASVVRRRKSNSLPRREKESKESDADSEEGKGRSPSSGSGLQIKSRRSCIPDRPNCSISLWSIMKNCIGKELTKIPMPVNFNEPLSTLQRLVEDYEYSSLLDKAAKCDSPQQQLVYIACFAISSYSTTSNRTGKPFNPLLGETYECDRMDDMGWRCVSEQVSHHPPMLAQVCEGRGWKVWQEFTMSSKFRGKYLQVIPLGIVHLEFPERGYHFTWKKVTTTVHNIIVGKLWVDHHGDMEIVNHSTKDVCHVKFQPYSYFSREAPRKVTGVVTDSKSQAHWVLQGTWDNKMEALRVVSTESSKGKPVFTTATPKVIWKRVMPPEEYDRMYYFTVLACQLNEPDPEVAPTDSRQRPDQRLMEEGNLEEANTVKVQLEEKQRQVRRIREAEADKAMQDGRPFKGHEPIWFKKDRDPITGNPIHIYQGEYWKVKETQQWPEDCPKIYLDE